MVAFVQKYIIYILVGVIILFSVIGGIQYARVLSQKTTIAKQAASINDLEKTQKALTATIKEVEDNAKLRKQISQAQQVISNASALIKEQNQNLKTKCVLEAQDEKQINDNLIDAFNNRTSRVLLLVPKTSNNSKTN